MNTLLKLRPLALALTLGCLTLSCSDDDNNGDSGESLLVEAQSNASLSTFVEALERTGLDATFNGNTNLTVFAPTNTAFVQFLAQNGYATINDVPEADLRELLLNHTMQGSIEVGEFLTGFRKTMARGEASATNYLDMYVDTSTGIKINGTSTVTTSNIEASNGMLHIVDKVIALPTLMTFVRANADLSSLENAILLHPDAELEGEFDGSGTADPYTLFAPLNSAFSSFLTELDITNLEALTTPELQTTLTYHALSGTNALSSGFTNNQTLETMAGQNLTVSLTGGGKKITDANSRVSTITKTDIQAANGVLHLVDKVFLPIL